MFIFLFFLKFLYIRFLYVRVSIRIYYCQYNVVPQFELVRISLSDIDKMGKNEPLTLVFNAFHLKFEINLKPVEAQETLIGKFTPIWIARSDRIAAQSVFFSPERSVFKYTT